MDFEDCVGSAGEHLVAVEEKYVPEAEGQLEGNAVKETLEKPFEGVETRVHAMLVHVLLQLGEEDL